MGDVQTLRRSAPAVSTGSAAVTPENVASVHDFQAFKARKSLNGERKTGLNQTFRAGPESAASTATPDADLTSRIERIKSSINRINALMTELRSSSDTPKG